MAVQDDVQGRPTWMWEVQITQEQLSADTHGFTSAADARKRAGKH